MKKLFTSESVTSGHPDKICDQISDAILDAYLKEDKNAKVACEVCVHKKGVLIVGEVTSNSSIDIDSIARNKILEIGYDNDELEFNGRNVPIIIHMNTQSSDIAMGIEKEDIGAGDQGMVFGFATKETDSYLPMPIYYAHLLAKQLETVRKNNILPYLRPDGKTQVTVEYNNNKPIRIDNIVIAAQHNPDISLKQVQEDIKKEIIFKIIPDKLLDSNSKYYINATGRFVLGGPAADSGLTGRKIMVDTYGSYSRHGGGAFSGKDATKVDRSGAYYARYVAKNIVAANLADEIEIQVAYAIGYSKPVSISINTNKTNHIEEEKILTIIKQVFDFSPKNMIQELELTKPIYQKSTCYGHFGKDLPWERLTKVETIKNLISNKEQLPQ